MRIRIFAFLALVIALSAGPVYALSEVSGDQHSCLVDNACETVRPAFVNTVLGHAIDAELLAEITGIDSAPDSAAIVPSAEVLEHTRASSTARLFAEFRRARSNRPPREVTKPPSRMWRLASIGRALENGSRGVAPRAV